MTSATYRTLPFPPSRKLIADSGVLSRRRNLAYGLLEMDVTTPRKLIRDHKQATGEALSFTAFVLHCLAAAIETHPRVTAVRGWRDRLILFDDVDISTLIEMERDTPAVPHIIRAANRRSVREIHDEIRSIQQRTERSPQDRGDHFWALKLPRFIRIPLMRLMMKNPQRMKHFAGTVVVTSIGMFGRGSGWGVGFLPLHTLGITLGGIAAKPVLIDGQICEREFLCVTLIFDHDTVDGAPIARFASHFAELLSEGHGLADLTLSENAIPEHA